jgi:hypothetical protein
MRSLRNVLLRCELAACGLHGGPSHASRAWPVRRSSSWPACMTLLNVPSRMARSSTCRRGLRKVRRRAHAWQRIERLQWSLLRLPRINCRRHVSFGRRRRWTPSISEKLRLYNESAQNQVQNKHRDHGEPCRTRPGLASLLLVVSAWFEFANTGQYFSNSLIPLANYRLRNRRHTVRH